MLFQGFEWYLPDDGNYYKNMILKLDELKEIGVTAIWIPPVYKATGTSDTGYGSYDLYDLGEFDQKGSIRTKYGTKEELKQLIKEIHKRKMKVYADVVLNHKAGADRTEKFMAVMVDKNDRNKDVGEPQEIEAWTGFDFPGRDDKYSDFKWTHYHFSGVDYDNLTKNNAIYRIVGENKGWNLGVSDEKGNFDYLMFSDIDLAHPEVKEELKKWAIWFIDELDLDGFRMDALKHMDEVFVEEFLSHIKEYKGEDFYILGEYWIDDLDVNNSFLDSINYKLDLFDVGLHFNLYNASKMGLKYDLRKIFDNIIVKTHPLLSVTFVDNHDSQPGESLESFIEPWFKEIAYGIIFLRKDGYPCLFYGDYYGTGGENPQPGDKEKIEKLAKIRKKFAYGEQNDYFESDSAIGWVRLGNKEYPNKCAVIISIGDINTIRMFVGKEESGKTYTDYTGNNEGKVNIDEDGFGDFMVSPGSISVWIEDNIDL
ncbi:glucan 1,4-alpha-maltohexaosidase precursor [Tissierella creatinophila DSM 6911]|uniref:Glucan 1,4-alpha-maltohexaosidase n=1 Tax=Tissierella creatinophila DSM 6911 TaxID=1123403 RepID=A0A1U7M2Y2_TISCR|nr:glucan 1,4-alpha-maltohexaosidase precursor [Tissierella creatinophila DSM 6911]